jgi:1-acyl-sn-glycerol-3-phosphate acyltransferase
MFYFLLRLTAIALLRTFFKFKVEGLENIPQKTNFIVAANHVSFMDPVALGSAIPKKIYWITMQRLYVISWLRWIMNKTESIPTGSASSKAIKMLSHHKNLGLFPEGGISHDGKLKDFRKGAALLAIKTGRPILPCAILGTYEALPVTARIPRRYPIKVKIGKPIYLLKEFDDVIDEVYLHQGIFRIRNEIKEMLNAG